MLTPKRLIIGAIVVIGIPAVALAWWLLSPLIINTEVSEEFPFAANAVIPSDMTMADAEKAMAEASEIEEAVSEPMPDSMTGAAAGSVQRLKSGTFQNADDFHKGSGTTAVYRDADGALVLRLEDFQVTNGPDLHVILTPHADPQGRDDVHEDGYVDLGKLKGNKGSQNYEIPPGTDVSAIQSVVIYCQPFHVVFSVANLQASP